MEKKDNKMLFVLLGIGLGIGVYYYLCKRKNELSASTKMVEETIEQ
jgi:hypothetical protein